MNENEITTNQRDFKGIWIPKEIWLNDELSWFEKILLAEIDSLDNEETHCTAGNSYFAEFFKMTERNVSSAISHLKELGLIEIIAFDGRHRVMKSQGRVEENFYADTKKTSMQSGRKVPSINITNRKEEYNNSLSKDKERIVDKVTEDKPTVSSGSSFNEKKVNKKDMYRGGVPTCIADVADDGLRGVLTEWYTKLGKGSCSAQQVQCKIDNLETLYPNSIPQQIACVQQSIAKGWISFYTVKGNYVTNVRNIQAEKKVILNKTEVADYIDEKYLPGQRKEPRDKKTDENGNVYLEFKCRDGSIEKFYINLEECRKNHYCAFETGDMCCNEIMPVVSDDFKKSNVKQNNKFDGEDYLIM